MTDRDDRTAGLCPDCAIDNFEMLNESGRFFATCPTCGKRGPEAGSLYEAKMAWQRMHGAPAKSMSRMVWMIAGGLCLIGAVVALIGWMTA